MNSMTYDKLYNNMVRKFTVEKDNQDYNLGDFMLMKAKAKKNEMVAATADSNLPVARDNKSNALTTVFSYVNDKLTVKEAPIRDRTIRRFPLRTSLSALCSAVVVCALVISCTVFGVTANGGTDNTVNLEVEETTENTEATVLNGEIPYSE